MQFTGLDLPNITQGDLKDEKKLKQIVDYMYQLTEQLRHVLNNLGTENMSDEFKQEITQGGQVKALSQQVTDAKTGVTSLRKQTADLITHTVRKEDIISAINQSPELIQILANKIALEGYVTINKTFSIDEEGYLRCTGGTMGAFSVDDKGGLFGNGSLRVGNMLLDGSTISGVRNMPNLRITGDNMTYSNYREATDNIYFFGMDENGELKLFDAYIYDTGAGAEASGYRLVARSPGSSAPSTPENQTVSAIQMLKSGVNIRSSPGGSVVGTASTGEIYGLDGLSGDWAKVSKKYTYSSTTGKYVASALPYTGYISRVDGSKVFWEQITINI